MNLIVIIDVLSNCVLRRRLFVRLYERISGKQLKIPKNIAENMTIRSLIDVNKVDKSATNGSFNIEENVIEGIYELAGNIGVKVKAKETYGCINWNKDPITKYVFPMLNKQEEMLKIAVENGIDVKVLWDLGRMQVLPYLAILYAKKHDERYINEFIEQVESFICQCESCTGIQWSCTMDVAIRAANLLVAFDLFNQLDSSIHSKISDTFKNKFIQLIYRHGLFIVDHLEVDLLNGVNQNHYLTNICGLLFISSYINCNKSYQWFMFSKREFFKEIKKQFHKDGTNFEFSTSYHDYSGEVLVYSAALIYRREKLPDSLLNLLILSVNFSQNITKRSGERVQIGDNDSGHFFHLSILAIYNKQKNKMIENHLSSRHFINAAAGLIAANDLFDNEAKKSVECQLVMALSNKQPVHLPLTLLPTKKVDDGNFALDLPYRRNFSVTFNKDTGDLRENGKWIMYQDFGLYCYKSKFVDMYVYIGSNEGGPRSHAHHDILHFELSTDVGDYFSDPGTGWYSINKEWREYFRNEKVHNAPYHKERVHTNDRTFYTELECKGELIFLTENAICVSSTDKMATIYRLIKVKKNEIKVVDKSECPFEVSFSEPEYISKGYGFIERNVVASGVTIKEL